LQVSSSKRALQYIATNCNKLQQTATNCDELQQTAAHYRVAKQSHHAYLAGLFPQISQCVQGSFSETELQQNDIPWVFATLHNGFP